jgi:hypothetical protein
MKRISKTIINCILISNGIQAQGLLNKSDNFTRQDSLRGIKRKSLVGCKRYLNIKVNPVDSNNRL